MTIIDSCILLDVVNQDDFSEPSQRALKKIGKKGRLFAPDIVFSEICLAFDQPEDARKLFEELDVKLVRLDEEALYTAAKAFKNFSIRNKKKLTNEIRSQKRILPDFYIGALAQCQGLPLLTRDLKRKWNQDFPNLQIITP